MIQKRYLRLGLALLAAALMVPPPSLAQNKSSLPIGMRVSLPTSIDGLGTEESKLVIDALRTELAKEGVSVTAAGFPAVSELSATARARDRKLNSGVDWVRFYVVWRLRRPNPDETNEMPQVVSAPAPTAAAPHTLRDSAIKSAQGLARGVAHMLSDRSRFSMPEIKLPASASAAVAAQPAAKTEPGGYPLKITTVLVTDLNSNGKCRINFPGEFFANPKIFKRPAAAADVASWWYGRFAPKTCEKAAGTPVQSAKESVPIVFAYQPGSRDEKVSGSSYPRRTYAFTAIMHARFVDGQMTGPVNVELTVRDDALADWGPLGWAKKGTKYDTGTEFTGTIYYRNGQMFLTKEDYQRPEMEAQAKKQAEQQRVAALQRSWQAAFDSGECERVNELDAQLSRTGGADSCRKAAEDRRRAAAAASEEKARADGVAALERQRSAAVASGSCDEVKLLDGQLRSPARLDECKLVHQSKTASANELYLEAGRHERSGNRKAAKMFFEAIVARFPTSELAIKATDNLSGLSRLEAIEASNAAAAAEKSRAAREQQEAIDRASRDAAARQAQGQQESREFARRQCVQQRSDCERGCDGRFPVGNARYGCKQGCPSCSQF